jgi:CheY-like chemotaxis protein
VQADPTRLEQIFSNLLNNASKFSDHGGKIFISVDVTGSNSNQRRQTGTARASAHSENGDEVVIAVRDDGMGISKEMLPHVFDLFAQADRSLDRSQGGLGIGLTMVRRLIELHGGKVEALSDGPRRGSEFIIRLPLHDGEPEETQPEPANAPKAEPGKCRILVVDDNLDGAESLAMLLRLAGHDVHIAFDGPNAVDIAAKVRPEVVLLDIGLPTMNGYEVVRQLRQRLRLKDTFIVALTGYGRDEDRQRAEEVGFDEYLTKPIDHDDLRELLARRFPSDSKGKK